MVDKPGIMNVLESGLRATTVRQHVVANNLANIHTPGFRRHAVDFEDILSNALDSATGLSDAKLAKLEPELYQPRNTPIKANGNDVDIDTEIGQLMKVASRHKTYLRLLNKMYKQMEMAIQDR